MRPTQKPVPALLDEAEPLLTPGEVAALFRVGPKQVSRWAATGRLAAVRTIGGHFRFRESVVRAALEAHLNPPAQ